MKSLPIVLSLMFSPLVQAHDIELDEMFIVPVGSIVAGGDPHAQLMWGILSELGFGLLQEAPQAAHWYLSSAQQGTKASWVVMLSGTGRSSRSLDKSASTIFEITRSTQHIYAGIML